MMFDLNKTNGTVGLFCFGGAFASYMAFFYYAMMVDTLEHVIAMTVFAIIGGIFLIIGAILLGLNNSQMKIQNYQKDPNNNSDNIVKVIVVGTVCVIALFVVLSTIIS